MLKFLMSKYMSLRDSLEGVQRPCRLMFNQQNLVHLVRTVKQVMKQRRTFPAQPLPSTRIISKSLTVTFLGTRFLRGLIGVAVPESVGCSTSVSNAASASVSSPSDCFGVGDFQERLARLASREVLITLSELAES